MAKTLFMSKVNELDVSNCFMKGIDLNIHRKNIRQTDSHLYQEIIYIRHKNELGYRVFEDKIQLSEHINITENKIIIKDIKAFRYNITNDSLTLWLIPHKLRCNIKSGDRQFVRGLFHYIKDNWDSEIINLEIDKKRMLENNITK